MRFAWNIIPTTKTTTRRLWSRPMMHAMAMFMETLRMQTKSPITRPPMEIMKIWCKSIIITHICRHHVITWETCTIYIMWFWMIEFRKSNSPKWFRFIFLIALTNRSVDKVTPKLFNIRLIKLIYLIEPSLCVWFYSKFESNIITYSNFSHIAIC